MDISKIAFLSATIIFGQFVHTNCESNFPGLNTIQSGHARTIIKVAKEKNLGQLGCEIAITVALAESNLRNLANNAVPASLKYKHDGVGSHVDAIGIFQQHHAIYKNAEVSMKPAKATSLFFTELKKVKNWKTLSIEVAAQKVQKSAYPSSYGKHVGAAKEVCKTVAK